MSSRKISAAINLLQSAGYTVTPPPAPVGRPRSQHTERIESLAASGASAAEIIAQTGLPRSTVDPVLSRWRKRTAAGG